MRRKKVSRTLTFLMAVAVVAGSIHGLLPMSRECIAVRTLQPM